MEKADEERLSMKIDQMLEKINTDPNPEELEEIKKLIKKKVPFTRRGYFSAILLKAMASKSEKSEKTEKPEKRKSPVQDKPVQVIRKKEPSAKPALEREERVLPEGSKTLYLNIGKMKHLYGKDLSKLLQTELGITRDDIYTLRVHDKYSFITMSEENCEKAIAKLNGMDIYGRKAQINYSNR